VEGRGIWTEGASGRCRGVRRACMGGGGTWTLQSQHAPLLDGLPAIATSCSRGAVAINTASRSSMGLPTSSRRGKPPAASNSSGPTMAASNYSRCSRCRAQRMMVLLQKGCRLQTSVATVEAYCMGGGAIGVLQATATAADADAAATAAADAAAAAAVADAAADCSGGQLQVGWACNKAMTAVKPASSTASQLL